MNFEDFKRHATMLLNYNGWKPPICSTGTIPFIKGCTLCLFQGSSCVRMEHVKDVVK